MEIRSLLFALCLFVCSVTSKKELREKSLSKVRHSREPDGMCDLEISCKGEKLTDENSIPVKIPIRGPRGPPGEPGKDGMPGEPGMQGVSGLPGLSAPIPKKIAFFVGLKDNMGPVTEHTDIVFDNVVTNIGGGYQEDSGRFTAPVNGTFHFNVIVSAQGRQKAAVMIIKNGAMIATVWAESIPYWATASNVAILNLNAGDQVWLMLLSRASYLHGYMYSTFSGFMLFEN